MERLKRAVTAGAIAYAVIFSILQETPSGPVDLVVSIDLNSSVTSSTVQSKSSGQLCTSFCPGEMMGGTLQLKHSEKNELRASAFSRADERMVCARVSMGIDKSCLLSIMTDFQNCFELCGFVTELDFIYSEPYYYYK